MEDVNVQKAIEHFEYGIKCDIFKEPVTSYAKLAVEALKKQEHLCVHSGKVSLVDGHIDNGMTDEDIIKAFEICYLSSEDCSGCPFLNEFLECMNTEDSKLLNLVEDVLNRQKAEVERLKTENEVMKTNCNSMCVSMPNIAKAERAEAIKEFAERLIKMLEEKKPHNYGNFEGIIYNLVKEMTESDG